jgi:hypothetical protein
MKFHVEFAGLNEIPADFHFLHLQNDPISINGDAAKRAMAIFAINMFFGLNVNGCSQDVPLCAKVREVVRQIEEYKPNIRSDQKIVLFIATQGLPSDGDVKEALEPLNGSPVHLVVRLCSDDAELKNAWKKAQEALRFKVDIVGGRSVKLIAPENKWLSYGEPLRQFREMGGSLGDVSFTQIDEGLLSFGEMKSLCEKM